MFIETFLLPSTILGIEDSAMNNQLPLTQFQEIEMKKKIQIHNVLSDVIYVMKKNKTE